MNEGWSLLSTHGSVLFFIASKPESTHREIARALNVTEKRVADVIRHLAQAEFITVHRAGRRNWYSLNRDAHFRAPPFAHICVDEVVRILENEDGSGVQERQLSESVLAS